MNIGKKIKDLRSAKMMTQSELAGDEITRNMLSRIESGSKRP
jgi:transcriptional regulator with XRE-family HTH domain